MIALKEISSIADLKTFVKFPFDLYKDSEQWVPPLISEEVRSFDKSKNPVFRDADARFFLAYKGGKIAGRVVVIINWLEVKDQGIGKVRFGWFDFIDDKAVSAALLNKVQEIGLQNQLKFMEGPLGFSNLDKVGVLIEGFDSPGTMITWYNYPYYKDHYESFGLKVEKTYLESRFSLNHTDPDHYKRIQQVIKARYSLRTVNFSKTKDIMPWADRMFELFQKTYIKLSSFVPISKPQIEYFKQKYLKFINPEYIKFVLDKDDQLVAFAIVMPSYSEAMKKARGRLFPFGIFHLNKARVKSKGVLFYLIGIHPDYQNKGITAMIIYEFAQIFNKKGVLNCYRSPELEDNLAIQQMWKYFKPEVYKRRCTYKLPLHCAE
ncbi:MAG: GTP cyclohydrolase [Flavobacteriaceae bacterium]